MGNPLDLKVAAERVRGKRSLYVFVKLAWHVVETAPYVDGWHIEEICRHLEAWIRRDIRELAIAVPPGSSKSLLCSVFAQAWGWIQDPSTRWMYSSVDAKLAARDALRAQALIQDPWFQARWGDIVQIDDSGERAQGAQEYYTTAGGLRFSTSVASKAVGWHVDYQIADDPIKPKECTRTACEETGRWWAGTMASRARNRSTFCRLVVQQRLQPLNPGAIDLVGQVKAQGYDTLILPLRYDPTRYDLPPSDPRSIQRTSIGGDRRTKTGELLCPGRIGPNDIDRLVRQMSADMDAQYEQDPKSSQSKILARELFTRRYKVLPEGGVHAWSWDCRFGSREDAGSYVVGQLWYRVGQDVYLVKELRGRWGYLVTRDAVRDGAKEYPGEVLIENKANGSAVEDDLKNEIPGIVMVEPKGGKVSRAYAVTAFLGHVYLPAEPWIDTEWLPEVDKFPSEPNDRGDALTQYLAHVFLGSGAEYQRQLEGLASRGRGTGRAPVKVETPAAAPEPAPLPIVLGGSRPRTGRARR